jgi:CheY-like chemotaxis protein
MAQILRPDVILMDIAMPVLGGIEAMRQILAVNPAAKVLILSAHSDDEYIEHMTTVGAVGFLEKHTSTKILINAVCEVAKGNLFFSPAIAKRMANSKKLMSMCSYCKKIRDARNYWQQIESYINERTGTEISHTVCPDCYQHVVIPELAILKKEALAVCTRTKIWPAGPIIVKFSEERPDAAVSYGTKSTRALSRDSKETPLLAV